MKSTELKSGLFDGQSAGGMKSGVSAFSNPTVYELDAQAHCLKLRHAQAVITSYRSHIDSNC